MNDTREVDVYWTVQDRMRWSVSLSEKDAWGSLKRLAAYEDDPTGWTVEHTREALPVTEGEIVKGGGESVVLDENASVVSRQFYESVHVFWKCPRCGEMHNCNLYDDRVNQRSPSPNPSVWFCERGEGIVLVCWQ